MRPLACVHLVLLRTFYSQAEGCGVCTVLQLAATSISLDLRANMTSHMNRKYVTYHYAARGGPSNGNR